MCGINGIISLDINIKRQITEMNFLLRHRGPDDEGYIFINSNQKYFKSFCGYDSIDYFKEKLPNISTANYDNYNVILAHRRLSIIDLSQNGHCPMSDESGKIWITYNGEIYNYIELRDELRTLGHTFQTESDTEVIIKSYLQWGKECQNHFNGMWAFAIWDSRCNELFLSRDRFGVKPLYYSITKNLFAFSSEIKPLMLLQKENIRINKKQIPFYVLYGNRLNTNETYLENIFSLKPSHYAVFKEGNLRTEQYYEISFAENSNNEHHLKDELIHLLSDSIKLRFRSDVPVGTCLSGGFDSSSIVALSDKILNGRLQTFSAVWKEPECDESKYIDIVNSKFDCVSNKIIPKDTEFEDVIDKISYYQEIPTEGPGLYPQWYVMQEAKKKVKVLLDGQGGDEVFGGYFQTATHLRSLIANKDVKNIFIDFSLFLKFLNQNGIHSFSGWLFPKLYNKIVRRFLSSRSKMLNPDILSFTGKQSSEYDSDPPKITKSYLNNLSYHFIRNITIPTLLHYEDRSSMAHSIESRVPFLDYRLVEFGLNLKPIHLQSKSVSRPLYRKALSPYLPESIVNRKDKLGYPVPFGKWTRTTLKKYLTDTLSDKNSLVYDFLNYKIIQNNLNEHFKNRIDYAWEIWRIIGLKKFLELPSKVLILSKSKQSA